MGNSAANPAEITIRTSWQVAFVRPKGKSTLQGSTCAAAAVCRKKQRHHLAHHVLPCNGRPTDLYTHKHTALSLASTQIVHRYTHKLGFRSVHIAATFLRESPPHRESLPKVSTAEQQLPHEGERESFVCPCGACVLMQKKSHSHAAVFLSHCLLYYFRQSLKLVVIPFAIESTRDYLLDKLYFTATLIYYYPTQCLMYLSP